MAKNDSILLDGIIDQRLADGLPSADRSEVFEYFCFEQLLKDYDLSQDEIESGWVDGRDDGGVRVANVVDAQPGQQIDVDALPSADDGPLRGLDLQAEGRIRGLADVAEKGFPQHRGRLWRIPYSVLRKGAWPAGPAG